MTYKEAKKAITEEGAFIEPDFAINATFSSTMANVRRTWRDLERLSRKSADRLIEELGMTLTEIDGPFKGEVRKVYTIS